MRKFGLVGYPLGHSFSKGYFTEFFRSQGLDGQCCYENYQIADIAQVRQLLAEPEMCGFNVTIPHKQAVIPFLDELSEEARQIGAVNCVKLCNGRATGYNTDCYGFEVSLLRLIGPWRGKALVLGSGGASKAVCHVLDRLGIDFLTVSRTPDADRQIGYGQLTAEILEQRLLIVNTTPLGMHPHTDSAPQIPYRHIGPQHMLYDLIYNPPVTLFMQKGAENGARTSNGAEMLRLQAEKSWEIWNSKNA